jgi:hypothetical protein
MPADGITGRRIGDVPQQEVVAGLGADLGDDPSMRRRGGCVQSRTSMTIRTTNPTDA